jgi:hypothetical protein
VDVVASLKHLKALRVEQWKYRRYPKVSEPLRRIGDLEHFSVGVRDFNIDVLKEGNPLATVLANSLSTLRTLDVPSSALFLFFGSSEFTQKSAPDAGTAVFCALESLTMRSSHGESAHAQALLRHVDFTNLTELATDDWGSSLYQELANLSKHYKFKLRRLRTCFNKALQVQSGEHERLIAAIISLISTFNTLESFQIDNHLCKNEQAGHSHHYVPLRDGLLQAIMKHNKLRSLRFSLDWSDQVFPCMSVEDIRSIISGLPHLEEVAFAPDRLLDDSDVVSLLFIFV